MDLVSQIMAYEAGKLDEEGMIAAIARAVAVLG